MNKPNADASLEAQLRTWYDGFEPSNLVAAESAAARALAAERARSRGSLLGGWNPRRLRLRALVGAAAAAATVAVALVIAPLRLPSTVAPTTASPGPSVSPVPSPTVSPVPSPTASPLPSPSIADTLDPSGSDAIWAAAIDAAGPIPGGGIWAVNGTTLMLSFDGGETWTSTSIPAELPLISVGSSTAVLDARHAWTTRSGPGSHTGAQDDFVSLVVYRTVDGGRNWESTTIPGNFAGWQFKLLFADAQHGFLVAADLGDTGLTTVFRTEDGGVSWIAGPKTALDWDLSISDATTLWVSSQGGGAMCGHCGVPLLQVSRDSGATWSVVSLPGYAGKLTSGSLGVAAAPTFFDPSTGYVVVHESKTDYPSDGSSRVFRTTDGGRTWSAVATAPYFLQSASEVDAAHWYGEVSLPNGNAAVTDDGGKTWRVIVGPDAGEGTGSWGTWLIGPAHGAWIIGPGSPDLPARVLYLTSDAGRTWHPANFGAFAPAPGL